jgi:hypothetical protein
MPAGYHVSHRTNNTFVLSPTSHVHNSAPSPMSTRNCGHSNSAATEQRSKPVVRSVLRVPVERDHRFRWKMITQSGGT